MVERTQLLSTSILWTGILNVGMIVNTPYNSSVMFLVIQVPVLYWIVHIVANAHIPIFNMTSNKIHQCLIQPVTYQNLLSAKSLQMLQYGQVGVHPSFDAVLCAGLFCPVQTSRGDLSGNALFPANVREVVNG